MNNHIQHLTMRHKLATLELYISDKLGTLKNLYSRNRGCGEATKLMQIVVDYADDKEIVLELNAQQYGDSIRPMLSNQQLKIFYEKFGFTTTDIRAPFYMVREPRTKNVSSNERTDRNLTL